MNVPNSLWGKIIQTVQKSYPRGEKKKNLRNTYGSGEKDLCKKFGSNSGWEVKVETKVPG